MIARHRTYCIGALFALVLAAPVVQAAEPPSVTPVMQRAIAQYEQGPEQLRRYVFRTRMIYGLDYAEVVKAHDAVRTAAAPPASAEPKVAQAAAEVR